MKQDYPQQKPKIEQKKPAAFQRLEGVSSNFKYIVRIMNTDLDGKKNVENALRSVKGVGYAMSNAACVVANINNNERIGELSDDQIGRLNEVLNNPSKFSIPEWMFNRRNDPETGVTKHILTTDLDFIKDNDIKLMKKMKSYRGMRHAFGLPVRGQRTRSNFRKNKGKVTGVHKAKIAPAKSDKKSDKK